MTKRKTHEEYVNQVKSINPNIEVLGTYVNNHTKILHKCTLDDYEWYTLPANILKGSGYITSQCCGNADEGAGGGAWVRKVGGVNSEHLRPGSRRRQ